MSKGNANSQSDAVLGAMELSRMRKSELLKAQEKGERLLNNPYHYKLIINFIFCEIMTAPNTNEDLLAKEFFNIVTHLITGKAIIEMPTTILDKEKLINKIISIVQGKTVKIDDDDSDGD